MINPASHRISREVLSSQAVVNQKACREKSSQTITAVTFRALKFVLSALLYVPLKVICGFNLLSRRVSQVFSKTFKEHTQQQNRPNQAPFLVINPIHAGASVIKNAEIRRACEENKYFEVWKAVKATPSIVIENATIIAINNMVTRLRESRDKINFYALNAWLENIAAERHLSL